MKLFAKKPTQEQLEHQASEELEAALARAKPPSDAERTWVLPLPEPPPDVRRAARPPASGPRPSRAPRSRPPRRPSQRLGPGPTRRLPGPGDRCPPEGKAQLADTEPSRDSSGSGTSHSTRNCCSSAVRLRLERRSLAA